MASYLSCCVSKVKVNSNKTIEFESKVKKQWIVLEDEEEIVLNTVNGRKNKAKEQLLDSVFFSLGYEHDL